MEKFYCRYYSVSENLNHARKFLEVESSTALPVLFGFVRFSNGEGYYTNWFPSLNWPAAIRFAETRSNDYLN